MGGNPSGRGRLPRTDPFRPRGDKLRVLAARRHPGEPFGPPELVAAGPSSGFAGGEVGAGIDASGAVTLVWPRGVPSRGPIGDVSAVAASSAPPGDRFAAPQVLSASGQEVGEPSLAVAPDGGALLAHSGNSRVHVYERRAGEDRFAKTATFGRGQDVLSKPTVSLRDGGGAVLAWEANGLRGSSIGTATRESVGVFGAPREVARLRPVDTEVSLAAPLVPDEPAAFRPRTRATSPCAQRSRLMGASSSAGRVPVVFPSETTRSPCAPRRACSARRRARRAHLGARVGRRTAPCPSCCRVWGPPSPGPTTGPNSFSGARSTPPAVGAFMSTCRPAAPRLARHRAWRFGCGGVRCSAGASRCSSGRAATAPATCARSSALCRAGLGPCAGWLPVRSGASCCGGSRVGGCGDSEPPLWPMLAAPS